MILTCKLILTGLGTLAIFAGVYTFVVNDGPLYDFTLGLCIGSAVSWGIETVYSAWKKRP